MGKDVEREEQKQFYGGDMSQDKETLLEKLALVAFKIDSKAQKMQAQTEKMQRMAYLARVNQKESIEFKQLEFEMRTNPRVTDFGDEILETQKIAKRLKKFYKCIP